MTSDVKIHITTPPPRSIPNRSHLIRQNDEFDLNKRDFLLFVEDGLVGLSNYSGNKYHHFIRKIPDAEQRSLRS